jgi:hypothetical protein
MLTVAKSMVVVLVANLLFGFNLYLTTPRGENSILQVPFTFDKNEIFVQVQIGGYGPVTMMVDANTDPSTIDLGFARSQNLKLTPVEGEATGGGSEKPQLYLTSIPSVRVGPVESNDLQALAIDLSGMSKALGTDLRGVLGNSFLSGRVVQIDYPKHVIRFYSPSSSYHAPTATSRRATFDFKYDEDDGCIIIEGVVVDGKPVRATIDTGSDGTFNLTPQAIELLGLTETARTGQPQASLGYKGKAQNTKGTVNRISIGPFQLRSPEVVFFSAGSGRDHKPWQVSIGNGFLKDFILTIDYPRKQISVEEPGSRPIAPDRPTGLVR